MSKKQSIVFALVSLVALAGSENALAEEAGEERCHVDVDTDNGGSQMQQCGSSATIRVGGPIRDVDLDHPLGKGGAMVPQAGRDTEEAARKAKAVVEKVVRRVPRLFHH